MKIRLGDRIRDTLSGAEGTVTGRTEWLYGCVRLGVQPRALKDGVPAEVFWLDEPQAERLPGEAAERGDEPPAGPQADAVRRPDDPR